MPDMYDTTNVLCSCEVHSRWIWLHDNWTYGCEWPGDLACGGTRDARRVGEYSAYAYYSSPQVSVLWRYSSVVGAACAVQYSDARRFVRRVYAGRHHMAAVRCSYLIENESWINCRLVRNRQNAVVQLHRRTVQPSNIYNIFVVHSAVLRCLWSHRHSKFKKFQSAWWYLLFLFVWCERVISVEHRVRGSAALL